MPSTSSFFRARAQAAPLFPLHMFPLGTAEKTTLCFKECARLKETEPERPLCNPAQGLSFAFVCHIVWRAVFFKGYAHPTFSSCCWLGDGSIPKRSCYMLLPRRMQAQRKTAHTKSHKSAPFSQVADLQTLIDSPSHAILRSVHLRLQYSLPTLPCQPNTDNADAREPWLFMMELLSSSC